MSYEYKFLNSVKNFKIVLKFTRNFIREISKYEIIFINFILIRHPKQRLREYKNKTSFPCF